MDENIEMPPMCTPCGNWFRRVTLSRAKCHIPIDDVLTFVNAPEGRSLLPDKRILIRVLKSCCMTFSADTELGEKINVNIYRSMFCTPSLLILCKSLEKHFFRSCKVDGNLDSLTHYFTNEVREIYKGSIVDEVIKVWWLLNGMPPILVSKKCARLTRKMLGKYVRNG